VSVPTTAHRDRTGAPEAAVPAPERGRPRASLTAVDAVALIIGIVVGAGIFKTPALVAQNTGSPGLLMVAWALGGLVSVVGALCYAELACAYPHAGGDYHYIARAFGPSMSFLFAWARMTVIQTGSIATAAFVFGDYASQVVHLDGFLSPSLYAVGAVVILTGLNILGVQQGRWTQNLLTLAKTLGLLLVAVAGILLAERPEAPLASATPAAGGSFGLAMIFVLYTFGGWNEAAYVSAEIRGPRRNILWALLWGVGIITGAYLLINLAYLKGLGVAGMGASEAVAADLMRQAFGGPGAALVGVLIAVAALGATNACIFTGARTNYALGCDAPLFAALGQWRERSGTPARALLVQGCIAVVLLVLGTLTRKGFETMVGYTVPVFWFFFLLAGISLFVLRVREPRALRPFRVPLYPLTPALFCLACLYMLYSSLAHAGVGALCGVAVLAAGVPLLRLCRCQPRRQDADPDEDR
jgi:basic amino acid/polyamine antiporter, APA family